MKSRWIRNFSIIAHIDHGKTTLSDRLLERTGAVSDREKRDQMLDSMDLERERGITIKSHAVTLQYEAPGGQRYTLNLIDTPGHVDFSYEVSRSLAACEGALLVVDASQGVEAQTLANTYLAVENNLEIIPVLNKIDLPNADVDRVREQIEQIIGIDTEAAVVVSAKEGLGIDETLAAIVRHVPPPTGDPDAPPKALIFDSWYDAYRGVVMLVRVMEGTFRKGMKSLLMNTLGSYEIEEMGIFAPKPVRRDELSVGEVGYVIANIKKIDDCQIGDTLTAEKQRAVEPCPGFREAKPMVFAGLYPTDADQYQGLRDAVEKLRLNAYLVNVMREARPKITDPALQEDLDLYVVQEATHSRQHKKFNDTLTAAGYDSVPELEERLAADYKALGGKRSLRFNLAYAEGFESMALAIGHMLIEDRVYLFGESDSSVTSLILWHFVEEIEHKNVAFDVFHHLYGSYFWRMAGLIYATVHIFWRTAQGYRALLNEDGLWRNIKSRWRLARLLARIFRSLIPKWLRICRPGYHPSKVADPQWAQSWTALYDADRAAAAQLDTSRLGEAAPMALAS